MVHIHGYISKVQNTILYITFKDHPGRPTTRLLLWFNERYVQIHSTAQADQATRIFVDWANVKELHFALRFTSDSIITYFNFKNMSIGVHSRSELPKRKFLQVDYPNAALDTIRVGGGTYTLPWKAKFASKKLEIRQKLTMFVKPTDTSGYHIALRNKLGLYGFVLNSSASGAITAQYDNLTRTTTLEGAEKYLTKDVEVEITILLLVTEVYGKPDMHHLVVVFDRKKQFPLSIFPREEDFVELEIDGSIEIYDVALVCERPNPHDDPYSETPISKTLSC